MSVYGGPGTLRYHEIYPFRYQSGNELSSNLLVVLIILIFYFTYNKLLNHFKNKDNKIINNIKQHEQQQLRQKYELNENKIFNSETDKLSPSFNIRLFLKEIEKLFGAVGCIVLVWSLFETTQLLNWIEFIFDEDITNRIQNITTIAENSITHSHNPILDISVTKQIQDDQPIKISYYLISNRFFRTLSLIILVIVIYYSQTIYFISNSLHSPFRFNILNKLNNNNNNNNEKEEIIDDEDQKLSILSNNISYNKYRNEILNEFNNVFNSIMEIPWIIISLLVAIMWVIVRAYLNNVPIHPLKPSSTFSIENWIDVFHLLSLGSHFSLVIIFYFLYQTLQYSLSINRVNQQPPQQQQSKDKDKEKLENVESDVNNSNSDSETKNNSNSSTATGINSQLKKKKKKKLLQQHQQQQQMNNINNNSISLSNTIIQFDQEGLLFILKVIIIFQTIYTMFFMYRLVSTEHVFIDLLRLLLNILSIYFFQTRIFTYLPVCLFFVNVNSFIEKNK